MRPSSGILVLHEFLDAYACPYVVFEFIGV